MTLGEKIKQRRLELNMTQQELADKIGYETRGAVNKIEKGLVDVTQTKMYLIAEALKTSPAWLMEGNDASLTFESICKNYSVPIYEKVSAGFGTTAANDVVEYTILPFRSRLEAEETICIRVQGDSMSPKIEDGDLIQVHKQTSVDSGDIAVVLLDDMEGFVKKVVYDDNSITLVSLNLAYPPITLVGADVQRVRVQGKVKKIIREV